MKLFLLWVVICLSVFFALGIETYRNPESFLKLTGVSAENVLLYSLLTTPLILFSKIRLAKKIKIGLLIFGVITAFLGIGLTVVDYLTPANYIYSKLHVNYQEITILSFFTFWILLFNTPLNKLKQRSKKIIFIAGVALLLLFACMAMWPFSYFARISHEDKLIENTQFIALFIASCFSLLLALRLANIKRKLVSFIFLLLSIGLFLVAGDEIAWGQRLFGVTSPEYFQENNLQNEITFHNLNSFRFFIPHIYLTVGLWGWASWIIFKFVKKRFLLIDFLFPNHIFFHFSFHALFLMLESHWETIQSGFGRSRWS